MVKALTHGGKKKNNVKGFSKQEGIPEKPQKKPQGKADGKCRYNGKIGRISEDEPVVGSKVLTLFVRSKVAFLNELLKS